MHSFSMLEQAYVALRAEGTRLAGGLRELAQRAAVYHHLYEHSGRNHIFPLIAAHGALWAGGYFAFGMKLGRWLSWTHSLKAAERTQLLERLEAFADAFREVNRQVCIDTYTNYHFTERFGDHPEANRLVSPELLAALNRVHAARRSGIELADSERRKIFSSHFEDEQVRVVGPRIEAAVAEFDWPLMKFMALRPVIRFAYFPGACRLRFRRFDRKAERVEKGYLAFDWGAAAGWTHVENALRDYDILPEQFFANSARHFAVLRQSILASA